MSSDYSVFTFLGLVLIAIGFVALLIPYLIQADVLRRLEELPPILVYVYRRDGFCFVTSPILVVVSILYFICRWLMRSAT